jgi:glycosyltransferase involved in cell wall biosynthesis
MKICLVRDYVAPAKNEMGAERVVETLAKGLVELGHDVVMKLEKGSHSAPAPLVDEIPSDCDLIHFNQWDPKDRHTSYNIPWVASIYGGGMETEQAWLDRTIGNQHIICVSKFVADRLKLDSYVWTCSHPSDFQFVKQKSDYFLWMAGTDWGEGKGLFTTIMLAKKYRFKLKIAGSGKNQEIIGHIKNACDDKIQFVGAVNGTQKAELLSNARALILLTQLPDACPTVVGEAMLSGTPVIGSEFGAMPELVNEKVGFICKSQPQFVNAILNIGKISTEGCYEYGKNNFTHIISAKKHLQYYENMLRFGTVSPKGEDNGNSK